MMWIFTFVVLMASIISGEETQTNISVPAGSPLYLPGIEACNHTKNISYELKKGNNVTGWYEDSKFHSRLQLKFEFDEKKCAFILRNLKLEDSGMYTITERYVDEGQPITKQKTFNITVLDHVTSVPFPTHKVTASNLTACNVGFAAVFFSLAPILNVLINWIYLIPCWSSYITQKHQNRLLLISGVLSLAFQGISISMWLSCGISNNPVLFWLAVASTAILLVSYVLPQLKCVNNDCFDKIESVLMAIFYILQWSFTIFVVIPFYPSHGKEILQKVWVLITFSMVYLGVFTLPCIVYMVYHAYFCPKITEEVDSTEMEKMNPSENGSSVEQIDKSTPLTV